MPSVQCKKCGHFHDIPLFKPDAFRQNLMDCATSAPTHPAYTNPTSIGPPGGWTFRKGLLAKIVYNEFCGIGACQLVDQDVFSPRLVLNLQIPFFLFRYVWTWTVCWSNRCRFERAYMECENCRLCLCFSWSH